MNSCFRGAAEAALILVLLAGAGCSADPSSKRAAPIDVSAVTPEGPPPRTRPAGPFRAATFNAGLAVGVLDHAEARVDHVVRSLGEAPIELLCVQEFWLEDHWQSLVEATANRLPNTH